MGFVHQIRESIPLRQNFPILRPECSLSWPPILAAFDCKSVHSAKSLPIVPTFISPFPSDAIRCPSYERAMQCRANGIADPNPNYTHRPRLAKTFPSFSLIAGFQRSRELAFPSRLCARSLIPSVKINPPLCQPSSRPKC